jgi:hypothetical protein
MSTRAELKRDIVARSEEDYVGLWTIIRAVERYLGSSEQATVRDTTLGLIKELLNEGSILAGHPTPDGTFLPEKLPVPEILDRIDQGWKRIPSPTIGDVIWFTRNPAPVGR